MTGGAADSDNGFVQHCGPLLNPQQGCLGLYLRLRKTAAAIRFGSPGICCHGTYLPVRPGLSGELFRPLLRRGANIRYAWQSCRGWLFRFCAPICRADAPSGRTLPGMPSRTGESFYRCPRHIIAFGLPEVRCPAVLYPAGRECNRKPPGIPSCQTPVSVSKQMISGLNCFPATAFITFSPAAHP